MAPFRDRWPTLERLFGLYPGGLDTWVREGGSNLQVGSPGPAGEDARLAWMADRLVRSLVTRVMGVV